MPYRIVCMDGGGALAVVTIDLLERLEAEQPGFLNQVDMFAGTSAGGINALMLAAAQNPRQALAKCRELWTRNLADTSVSRLLQSAGGRRALVSNRLLKESLESHFETVHRRRVLSEPFKLKHLIRHVVIPAFALDGVRLGHRCWKPKVFHFCGANPYDQDHDEEVIDVALRTSAVPVVMPIYQGHVDGGLFANNPAMCAIARALPDRRHCPRCGSPNRGSRCRNKDCRAPLRMALMNPPRDPWEDAPGAKLEDLQVFSVGISQPHTYLQPEDPDWGWRQWMFDPEHPAALFEATFEADSLAVDYQCVQLLGRDRYFRLEPALTGRSHRHLVHHSHFEILDDIAEATKLDDALGFLRRARWGRPRTARARRRGR